MSTMSSQLNFVRQQGFKDATPETCIHLYPSLMWQPRVILVLVLLGLLVETGWYFVGLGVLLWWNVLVPRLNPFDAIYNRFVAPRRGMPRLAPARVPRRTAQGIAGSMAMIIGAATLMHQPLLAWAVFVFMLVAVLTLAMGRFCLGSYLYHILTGQFSFANRTMPWSRDE